VFDFSQMPVWSLALIPVAIGFLWLLFRTTQTHKRQQSTLSSEYFKGLNYLLNDEQGKALDIFVKLVESNWDTIDTHFALGKIYRRNGEMDKAIKIHQGLIARPSLPERYRSKILLELGYDYLGAGWFDRAEGLFKEVLIQDEKSTEARHNLILIYQQEKDWSKAIDIAADLFSENPAITGPMIAHYYCELAEISRTKGDISQLENHANKALRYDADCVRATILLADQIKATGDDRKAIKLYESIEKQDAESIILVIDSMLECYTNLSS
jgi:lipopolysaccharide biosynthesis regulator YciM